MNVIFTAVTNNKWTNSEVTDAASKRKKKKKKEKRKRELVLSGKLLPKNICSCKRAPTEQVACADDLLLRGLLTTKTRGSFVAAKLILSLPSLQLEFRKRKKNVSAKFTAAPTTIEL